MCQSSSLSVFAVLCDFARSLNRSRRQTQIPVFEFKEKLMKPYKIRSNSRAAIALTMALFFIWILTLAFPANAQKKEKERLQNCAKVLKEIMDIPDDVPKDVMDKAECVLVLPSVRKSSFLLGGSYGRGAMSCRTGKNFDGPWSPPAMYRLV